MNQDIKCSGGCNTILGHVELEDGQEYQGDAYYGMYCENCPLPTMPQVESELDILKRQMQELLAKKNNTI